MNELNVGLIGCGAFAQAIHIPNLKKNPKYHIYAAMDIDESVAREVAEDTGAEYATSDMDRLLSDGSVDVVFITTRHDSHAELAVRAAEAGKHVLCEKPMGLSREECRAVSAAVKKTGVKYTVGYNRGMAPLITKSRELLSKLDGKKLIYHRIQGPFPSDNWIHDPELGGGRFVGEGCHIFDLLCELVQSSPVTVYASGGTFLNPESVKTPDSGIVTITFADGSVGTTLIASAGCAAFPKESTEIYCCNRAISISDFRKMEYMGFDGHDHACIELDAVDKGWYVEIDALADAIINDTESPNGIIRAARAAVISYMAGESVHSGAPVAISEKDYSFQARSKVK